MNDDNSAINGDNMSAMSGGSDGGAGEEEVYTAHTEREVAFKLLAAHALVDRDFYFLLRKDPVEACTSLHIVLEEDDYEYLRGNTTESGPGIDWRHVDEHEDEIRQALNRDTVVRSLW